MSFTGRLYYVRGIVGISNQHQRLTLLLKLLRQVSSLEVVSHFLKQNGATHSIPSWDTALDLRILPALEEKKIVEQQLVDLLADAEEHGRHHVFLYKVPDPVLTQLLDLKHATKWAATKGLGLNATDLHEMPEGPTVCNVRNSGSGELVVKVVEPRLYNEYLGEETKKNLVTKTWRVEKERAINVARLRAKGGLLELRVRSKKNTNKYQGDLDAFWNLLKGLFVRSNFSEVPLQKAKDRIFRDKGDLSSEIRFSDSTLRNDGGVVLTTATGRENKSLFEDPGARDSADAFMSHDGYCEHSNIWWIKQKNGIPSKDTHVLLGGERNEFAITAACTKTDYEFVLERILRHGK